MNRVGITAVLACNLVWSSWALAQDAVPETTTTTTTTTEPPAGAADTSAAVDTSASASASTTGETTASTTYGGTTTTTTTTTAPTTADAAEAGGNDHDLFIGRFAVTYFGVSRIPIADDEAGPSEVVAPTVGIRHWFTPMIGLDAGLGIAIAGGSDDVGDESTDLSTTTGVLLHAGLPLALSCGQHFCFEVIPELNFGFASATYEGAGPGGDDIDVSGSRFDLGARVGGEVHFGFMDIPQLSLVATVGLHYRRTSWGAEAGDSEASSTRFAFGTSVQGDPWAIFTNNISALYYF